MRYLFLIFAAFFFFMWLGAFVVFHVAGALIHLALIVALLLFVVHFLRHRSV
jgi:Family of unknown function (DUF5670)